MLGRGHREGLGVKAEVLKPGHKGSEEASQRLGEVIPGKGNRMCKGTEV